MREKDAPLKGTFSPGGETLPRLLMQLHASGLTGTLVVTSGHETKKLFLKKGDAVFASSNSRDDWLGVALMKAGKITLEQFEHSTGFMKKSGKRHGAVLVELGYITPKELFRAVKFQVKEIIYSMFGYDRAGYEFLEGEIPEEVITLMMSMGSLIYEGVGRIDSLIRIKEELPPMWTVLCLSGDPLRLFQGVRFSAKDKMILSLVDGKKMIKQVIEDSGLNSFEAMKIIYVFWAIGLLTGGKGEAGDESGDISADVLFLKPYEEGKDTFEARVAAFEEGLPRMGSREVLGVSETAGLEEIKDAYYRLAREFHPDRVFDSEDRNLKEKLTRVFDAIKNAYLELTASLPAAGETKRLSAWEPVEGAPAEGLAAKPDKGIEALREAVRLDPSNPEGWRLLAIALSAAEGAFNADEAEEAMLTAIGLDPLDSGCYLDLGSIYLKWGRAEDARRQFEKSLVLNPENRRAREQLEKLGG